MRIYRVKSANKQFTDCNSFIRGGLWHLIRICIEKRTIVVQFIGHNTIKEGIRSMVNQVDKSKEIPGTTIFDGVQSRKGYRLNKFAMSFTRPKNREAFSSDEEAYMEKWDLSNEERRFIRLRDYRGLIEECGGNIYMIMKLGTCTGHGLYHVGAQLRGETFEEFLASRNASGAR